MLCVNSLWHSAVTVSNENKVIETYSCLLALPLSKRTKAGAHLVPKLVSWLLSPFYSLLSCRRLLPSLFQLCSGRMGDHSLTRVLSTSTIKKKKNDISESEVLKRSHPLYLRCSTRRTSLLGAQNT